jgi:signal transduction histidine kinase/DNA-binding response OmpR family regulator
MSVLRFGDWPLRTKMLGLLLAVSTVPLVVGTIVVVRAARARLHEQAVRLLDARADRLVAELDAFHRHHRGLALHVARAAAESGALAGAATAARFAPLLTSLMPMGTEVRGATLADAAGVVVASSDPAALGLRMGDRSYMKQALAGTAVISDVFFATRIVEPIPLIAYAAPVPAWQGNPRGAVTVYVRASAFWDAVRRTDESAGQGSYAVVMDRHGVRIAHGLRDDLLFRPAGPLPRAELEAMVLENRFGERTRELLEQPVAQPAHFELARAPWLDDQARAATRRFGLATQSMNLSVARRLSEASWTVVVNVPEASIYAPIDRLLRGLLPAVAAIVVLALVGGLLLARSILGPLRRLVAATDALGAGDLNARVAGTPRGELGALATRFNDMAAAMARHRNELEERVRTRTLDLERANEQLISQKEELVTQQSELHAQTRELKVKHQDAQRADRLKNEFLANMSHELRTPLNSIIGFSELVLDEARVALGERHRQYLEDVLASGKNLLALINDILDLSKIEAGQVELRRQPVVPSAAVEEACQLMSAAAAKRRVTLEQLEGATAPVAADPAKLRQILLNLLSNAVKFSPEGGRVELGSESATGAVRFFVRDGGPGIADELRPRLFQPFVQGETPLTKKHEGTGLGLAICRRLVEQHGGTMGVDSVKGRGSSFHFTIPLADPPAARQPVGARALEQTPAPETGGRPILVVDDDTSVTALLRGILERAGHAVVTVGNGEAALVTARAQRPAAVVVDLGLPDMAGGALVEALATDERTSGVPLLVLTARDLDEAERARLRPLVAGVARKGDLVRSELLAILDRALRPRIPGAATRGCVLVVDDHDLNRELVRSILERRGFEVVQACDGEEGVAVARQRRPQVILMDLAMPKKDGLTATRELKADPATAGIPIVALTALAMRGDEGKAIAAGIDEYLTKPIERKRLEETVERLITQGPAS